MIVFEHELCEGYFGSPGIMQKVSAFLDLVTGDPACSLVVLDNKFLRNKRAFGLTHGERFKVCKLSEVQRTELLKACVSHGHLSVFFVLQNADELSRRFLELGFYGQPTEANFSADDANSPLNAEAILSLENFLASANGKAIQEMLAFSHDAGEFYRLYPWRKQHPNHKQ